MALTLHTEDSAQHGRAYQIAQGVTRIVAPNPGPFTFTGSSTYLIGSDRLIIIDPGPALEPHLEALLNAIDGRPVDSILLTHRHPDHAGLAPLLASHVDAPILAHAIMESRSIFSSVAAGLMDEVLMRDLKVDDLIIDQQRMTVDSMTLKALYTPGHTSDHLCFLLSEPQVIKLWAGRQQSLPPLKDTWTII